MKESLPTINRKCHFDEFSPLAAPQGVNTLNLVQGVATIYHQIRCMRWGRPSLFMQPQLL